MFALIAGFFGVRATIRNGREILCLMYAGFFLRGEDQWEAWKWSCDLRAKERPKKTASNCTDTHIDRQYDSMTELLSGANSVKNRMPKPYEQYTFTFDLNSNFYI